VDKREKLLYLAIAVAIIGTAALYALSASMEEQQDTYTVSEVLKNPNRYLNKDIRIQGNITDIRHYGNTTAFYLREGDYSLRCVYFGNMTITEGNTTVYGYLKYNEEWGNYEFVVKDVEHGP
jgi:cytochrome c-type biogenesis protein CcmE